jgi:hypothetical protein
VVIARTLARIAFAASAVVAVAIAVVACGTVADLDVQYDSVGATMDGSVVDPSTTPDAGQVILRDSSFVEPDVEAPRIDPSDAGPCEPDSDDGGGCDFSQGLGCCLLPAGNSRCIFQWEISAKCTGGLFVGCRGDDPNSESACCWRDGPPGSNSRMSVLGASCDGGAHACNVEAGAGCASGSCTETTCLLSAGSFTVGSCGPQLTCP